MVGLVLAGLILVGHGWCLGTGLFLDDHSHFAKLQKLDWSFASAVDSARLGIVGEVLDIWNRHEVGLRFFRPVAFWTMKLEYTLVGWRPWTMHAISLGWHWLAAMLVAALAYRCVGSVAWAGVAGGLFALHPGQVACTYWVASQTELQVTVWVLGAFLCYGRYSGWPERLFDPHHLWHQAHSLPHSNPRLLVPTVLCFAMALGCRENAVMFVPLVFLGDLLFRGAGGPGLAGAFKRMRWRAYLLLAVVVVLYLILRWLTLGGFPLPGPPYLVMPGDPLFWPTVLNKFVLNMLALFAFVPVVPVGGLTFFQARPAEFYLPFLGIVAGWGALLWVFRRRRGLLLAFGWLILTMLPLLPVFSSPHHLYLPSVGFALILTCALGLAGGLFKEGERRPGLLRSGVAWAVVMLHLVGLAFGSWAMGWVYRAGTGIEDLVQADIAETAVRPIRDGDHLFLINTPMLAYYVVLALQQRLGLEHLQGHVLTFSPSPLLMGQPGRVERLDEHTLRVSVQGDPYFAGTSGRVLLQGMGLGRMPVDGELFEGDLYTVTVEHADETGVGSLLFRFDRPLDSPEFHFFLTSRYRMAYALDFAPDPPLTGAVGREVGG